MKRKRVYAHRTLKVRNDFLDWLRNKSALYQQTAEDPLHPAEPPSALDMMAWADDGGRVL